MQASQTPTLIPLPFAANGNKNVIPEASQIPANPGGASLNDGFPPETFTPIAAGGIAPDGGDFNGIFNLITAIQRWQNAGGSFKWNSAFATDVNVGGYPAGATLLRADGAGFWLNLTDNNATNPDATDGSAANWAPLEAYGIAAIAGLTNANVTLTPAQYGLPIITLAGALTGNVQIVFPATKNQWLVINNTTGNFTATCKTSAGTGVVVAQGGGAQLYGDGTNIVLPNAQQVGPATQPQHAMQLGQATGRLLRTSFYFNISGTQYVSVNGQSAVTTGATVFNSLALTTLVDVEVLGAGASGGGTGATTSSQVACASGGGAGGYSRAVLTSGFTGGIAITVGRGGVRPAAGQNFGNSGGTASFGSVISSTGGTGGNQGIPAAAFPFAVGTSAGGSGSGGTINSVGVYATVPFALSLGQISGSFGGSSIFGSGGQPFNSGGNGADAVTYGAGGGGAVGGPSQSAFYGGAGQSGLVIVREYA